MSQLERLSGDYNRGYTRAIQDIIEIFEYIQPDLEHHDLYKGMWIVYYNKHPELVEYAKQFDSFHDMFRGRSKNCQADVIAEIVKDRDAFVSSVKAGEWYQTLKG